MALDARTLELIRQKAESGQTLSAPTSEKTKFYNQHQQRTQDLVRQKAMSGQQLDTPNQYKMNLYQKFQNEPIDNMFNQQKSYLDTMYNQQRESQLAQMRAARDKALGQINQQKTQIAPQYQQARNQADVVSQQNVQKLREVMAANGLSATGENVSANVAANNERLNSLNQLNLQERQTMDDFDRRITDLNDPQQEQALIAALEAERSRAMFDAYNRSQDVGYQRLRDTISDSRYNKEWQASEQQRRMDNDWRRHTFNNMSASEKKQFEWTKAQFGEEMAWRMYEMEYNGELNKSMSQAELDALGGFNGVEGGGGYKNNYKTNQAGNSPTFQNFQGHMSSATKMGVPAAWATGLTELIGRESSWNPSAKNPKSTAHGYGQFLKSTRSDYEKKTGLNYDNPVHQIVMMAQYVKDRYGSPEKALAFWDKNNWY